MAFQAGADGRGLSGCCREILWVLREGAAVAGEEDGGGTLETALGIPLRSVGWGAYSAVCYVLLFCILLFNRILRKI